MTTKVKGFKSSKRTSKKYLLALAVAAAIGSGFSLPAASAGIIKSDTTTMNAAADWSGTAPTISTVGEFSNVISTGNEAALTLGGNVSLMGMLFDNNLNGPVTIANTGGFTLTLGSSGIDMSAANQNVTINSIIALQAGQSWNVVTGRTLTVGGNIISGAAGTQTLTLNGTGNTSISGAIGGGTGSIALIQSGTGTTTLSGINTYTGGTTVSAGVLSLSNVSGYKTTALSVASGATLVINVTGTSSSSAANAQGSWAPFNSVNAAVTGAGVLALNGTQFVNAGLSTGSMTTNLSARRVIDVREWKLGMGI